MDNLKQMKNKKLCDWNKSEINKNQKLLISIVKTPSHYCKKCVRTANEDNYLCKAVEIK